MGGTAESNPVLASTVTSHHANTIPDLQEELRKFWELEEVSTEPMLSPEEEQCERLFRETHRRTGEGRYVVRLPRRENPPTGLGASRRGALQILRATERRLDRDPSLRQRYREFMDAYHSLGHMEPVLSSEGDSDHCYLPHHAVVKPSGPSGGVRVVFNASFRTETGASLNDVLLPGPKLQPDLWVVLSRWRIHRYAFATDIVKMFRQILVAPEDTNLQRILWRADPASAVRDYRLTTVTYGTAPAPYLAIRTLLQLAEDQGERYPRGADVLRSNIYVDDILAGASTLEGARQVRDQTVELLAAAGFRLSKWAATHSELCDDEEAGERIISMGDSVGTLGLWWSPAADSLQLRVVPAALPPVEPTKRNVLSQIARLFDPAGWTAPTLIIAKILIQDLWRAGVDWDQPLFPSLRDQWVRYATSLPELNLMRIPRWTGVEEGERVTLHGFSDASERAYAAAVYVRSEGPSDQSKAQLLVAKTKVAPVKPTSIPRLELCGAVLLARLLRRTAAGLQLTPDRIQAWTDARVVLAWIRSHPSRWRPFVANRVAAIQELVPAEQWSYVPTRENPADHATRGLVPSELAACTQWWRGPSWLRESSEHWPIQDERTLAVEEEKRAVTTAATTVPTENEILTRFSSLTRLVRVSSWCCRFLPAEGPPRPAHLTTAKQGECLRRWLRIAQCQDFAGEIEALSRARPIPNGSSLGALRPVLGPDGLLRVGGRLARSLLAYEERHPVILAKRSYLAVLLVRDAHHRTLHGGPQLVRSVLSRRYWIVHANSLIRQVIHQCVRCVRHRGAAAQQQMGQLPADRVRPGRPFESAGVDFAGPILLRAWRGRGQKTCKGYVCLFVCMATRAVHLEPVSDLTTEAFLAAFRRFVARRGRCSRLTSDNGTNFRGADRELQNMMRGASQFYRDGRVLLAADGTDWSFIPPSAPHFGGLWEAGVRAVKHHLRRVLDGHHLTYEELATLLCQVEACLNSRPLYPLSADSDDLEALTPGHFLIGEPPINVPEPSTISTPTQGIRLRWQLVTNLRDHIWGRWSREYLHHLQQLSRWRKLRDNVKPGALVLVRSELTPPAKWPLGRVREVHPGADGLVRVVTVDTASGRLTRPIAKICVLPTPENGEPSLNGDGETAE